MPTLPPDLTPLTPLTPLGPTTTRALCGPILLWALLLVCGLLTRPPIPIDETRYLGVAWEMWLRGDLLVPYLLGEPYHHKPPLLFWGMHLGWWMFGVSEWWARSVAPLFALGTLLLSVKTARVLWPERSDIARLTPWLLVGVLFWSVFATLTMFDMLMAACALAAGLGLAIAALRQQRLGFVLTGCAIGVGVLAKGPVILLHVLPLMVFAPWWATLPRARWSRWYFSCFAAVILGGAIALCWAIPAAWQGGETYANALFWSQSAGRIVGVQEGNMNPHRHGWWWFLPFLPALFFPWAIWPPTWRALRKMPSFLHEPGVRWCLCWCGSAFLLHSLISGKQVHYLIPLVAPAVLLFARALADSTATITRRDRWPVTTVLVIISLVLLIGPLLSKSALNVISLGNREAAPHEWGAAIGLIPGIVTTILTAVFIALPASTVLRAIQHTTIVGMVLLVILHVGVTQAIRPTYDLAPISQRIAAWQTQGIAVARIGSYRAEYQFLGRLVTSPTVIGVTDVVDWIRQNPNGILLMTFDPRRPLIQGFNPAGEDLPHRGVRLGIWQASQLLGDDDDY